jgi:hypothetical protein
VPTFGSPNVSQPLGNSSDLTINEWFTTGSYDVGGQLFNDDFIELHNASLLPVALGGLHLTDDPVQQPGKHQIQALSFINPNGYTVFTADANLSRGPDHVGFKLAAERGWISLFDTDLSMLDTVLYGAQTSAVSQGRTPDGGHDYTFFAQPTAGLDTSPPSIPTGLSIDLESGIAGYKIVRDGVEIGAAATTLFVDSGRDANTIYSYAVLAINGEGDESALSSPALDYQITPVPLSINLSVRDSYLSSSAVLVRVDVRDPSGNIARDLWNATATLTTDVPAVSLSADQVELINGMGSVLVTFSGGSDFTLFATVDGIQDSRALTSLDGNPQTFVAGDQSGIWSGVIHVTGDVTVPVGQTLSIDPGTLVILDGDAVGAIDSTQIVVAGTLDSRGTDQSPVTFTASNPVNPWGEIDINGGNATFDYTVVTRAGNTARGGHTGTGPAFRVRNNATIGFANGSVANIHGKIMQATSGEVIFSDSLLTRAVMGAEIDSTSLLFRDSWIVDMNSSWHYDKVDNDNDGIYLHSQLTGQDITLSGSVVALVGDDGIDTLGSGVVTRDMIVRDIVDKGYSVYHGWVAIEKSLIVNGDSDSDGDGDADGNDFLAWQRNYNSATAGAAAGISSSSEATEMGGSDFFSTTDIASGALSDATSDPLGPVRTRGSGQDIPALPENSRDLIFEYVDIAGWSLPQSMPKTQGSPFAWLDHPRSWSGETPIQPRPLQRNLVVDDVRSRLHARPPRDDLDQLHKAATDAAFATVSIKLDDIAWLCAQSVAKARHWPPNVPTSS